MPKTNTIVREPAVITDPVAAAWAALDGWGWDEFDMPTHDEPLDFRGSPAWHAQRVA